MSDCIFCKIAAGEIKSEILVDRSEVVAFRDANPQAPVHALVVPKRHVKDVTEMTSGDGELLVAMVEAANEVARSEGIVETGYRLVFNVGPDAGQTVFHLHLHVLGGRAMAWPPG